MRCRSLMLAGAGLCLSLPIPLFAQSSTTSGAVDLSGYLQTQYERLEADGTARDRVLFRRLIVTIGAHAGTWSGELEADLAPVSAGERLFVRDVFLRYHGWEDRGLTLTVGNQKIPFSRSVLGSASRRSLVERPVVGERATGSPGRSLAVRLDGVHGGERLQWSAAAGSSLHAPDADEIRIDSVAAAREGWNEGVLLTGRGEWHPFGTVPLDQGSFGAAAPFGFTAAAGVYWWHNDGDRNLNTRDGRALSTDAADLEDAVGVEISGGLRGHRLSLDAEWHRITGRTLDASFDGGLYRRGSADLVKGAVEAGYMVVAGRMELLAAIDALDASAREAVAWRPAVGANWYFDGHRIKVQLMHREAFNDRSVRGARAHATFVQAQFVF